MTDRWYLARRVAWTVVAAYLVLSATFFVFAFAPDPNQAMIGFAASYDAAVSGGNPDEAAREAISAYREARNYDEPLLERYRKWVVGYATLQWGYSVSKGRPVVAVVADAAPVTLAYLLPAVVVSVLLGVAAGLYSATRRRGVVDWASKVVAYSGLALPAFFLGELLLVVALKEFSWYGVYFDDRAGILTRKNLASLALPAVVVTANMLAVQLRYARAESLDHVTSDFVKRVRASGGGAWLTVRHVLRNAAVPLVSLFFTETLTVLFVSIYVIEVVFQLPGLGNLAYRAIHARDVGLILATTMLPVFVGVFGNLVQDVAYTVLDPRVDYDDR